MTRPQVADGGPASNVEGSCECIEEAVADCRQGVVLQLGGWSRCLQLITVKTDLVTVHIHVTQTCTDPLM
jgi:hypothetical protein